MKTIRLYYNKECENCARSAARLERWLDWRDRVEVSSETPKTGPLRRGQIAIEDLASGQIWQGSGAFAQLCRHVPIYSLASALLLFARTRAWLDRSLSGCQDHACGSSPVYAVGYRFANSAKGERS